MKMINTGGDVYGKVPTGFCHGRGEAPVIRGDFLRGAEEMPGPGEDMARGFGLVRAACDETGLKQGLLKNEYKDSILGGSTLG